MDGCTVGWVGGELRGLDKWVDVSLGEQLGK